MLLASTKTLSPGDKAEAVALLSGLALTAASYSGINAIQAIAVNLLFLGAGCGLLFLPGLGGPSERATYRLVFAVGILWAGLGALFADRLGDPVQLTGDAGFFYETTRTWGSGTDIFTINGIFDSAGPVLVWHYVYEFFRFLGVSDGRFIGIAVNTAVTAATAVVGAKCMHEIYGQNDPRIRQHSRLFALTPILMLFAGVLMREAMIIFAITLLAYCWIRVLAAPSIGRAIVVALANAVAVNTMYYLRAEFDMVPICMALAAAAAMFLAPASFATRRLSVAMGLFFMVIALAPFVVDYQAKTWRIGTAIDTYGQLVQSEFNQNAKMGDTGKPTTSLGAELLKGRPAYLKAVVGSAYVWLFPIPIWGGLLGGLSLYHIAKSLQAIFVYLYLPALAIAAYLAVWAGPQRRPVQLFLICCIAGFTLGIAATSLESRHLAPFLPMAHLLALYPDWRQQPLRKLWRRLALLVLGGMVLLHLLWYVLKYLL